MVAFPVFKLGALVIKQVSKPLANIAKARAKKNPFFRNYICMPPAQFYHWCEIKLKMWTMNLGKPVNIPKLNESSAIELGAELVGEAFIFTVASGILIFEYIRQSRKDTAREAERLAELERIQNDLRTLYIQNSSQEGQIRELVRLLGKTPGSGSFNPQPFSENSIPEHHREHHDAKEEDQGTFSTVKGWVFNAIEYVLPTDAESQPKIILVQQTRPETDNCKCEDSNTNVTVTETKVDKKSLEPANKQDPNR